MDTNTTTKRSWLAAGGGVLVGAAGTVAALLALGWSAGSAAGGSAMTLTLPQTADGLRTETEVVTELRGGPIEGREEAFAETADLLSASRGGAAAAVQGYADEDLEVRVTVWAVADESPRLWASQEGEKVAELSGLATPWEWVERDAGGEGEEPVECVMRVINPTMAGSDEEPEATVLECQLVTDGVTLLLEGPQLESIDRPVAILRDVAANLERG